MGRMIREGIFRVQLLETVKITRKQCLMMLVAFDSKVDGYLERYLNATGKTPAFVLFQSKYTCTQ